MQYHNAYEDFPPTNRRFIIRVDYPHFGGVSNAVVKYDPALDIFKNNCYTYNLQELADMEAAVSWYDPHQKD